MEVSIIRYESLYLKLSEKVTKKGEYSDGLGW
jgi:hypothetical protein